MADPFISQLLSLDSTPPPDQLPLATEPVAQPVSEPALTDRAYKATVGLGPILNLGYNDVYDQISKGKEADLRTQGATSLDQSTLQNRTENVTDALKKTEGTPTPAGLEQILGMPVHDYLNPKLTDPDSVIEKTYAFNTINLLSDAAQRNPAFTQPLVYTPEMDHGTDVLGKHAFVTTMKQNLDDEIHNMGWGSYLWNLAPTMVQAVQEYKLRGVLPGSSFWSGLLGDNLEEQRKARYQQPFDEFKQGLMDDVTKLKDQNPLIAQMYLQAMAGTTSDEKSLNNLFTIVGASDLATGGKIVAKGAKALYEQAVVRSAVRDVVEAASVNPSPVNVTAATGDVGEAAVKQVTMATNGSIPADKALLDQIPSALRQDIEDIKANPGRLGTGLVNMLDESYNRFIGKTLDTLGNVSKVMRLPLAEASPEQISELKGLVRYQYPELDNSVLDVNIHYNPFSNSFHYGMDVGKPGGELFGQFQVAQQFARVNGIEDAQVVKQGLGYYLTVTRPVDETTDIARSLLLTASNKTPEQGLFKSALSWLTTPENTMAFNQRVNRKVATYAQSTLNKLADSQRRYIQDIKNGVVRVDPVTGEQIPWYKRAPQSAFNYLTRPLNSSTKERWQDLERVLQHNQQMPDRINPELKGDYFRNPHELEQYYLQTFNRLPDYGEIQAYFAHTRLTELDRIVRNFSVYRNKTRLGTLTHTVSFVDKDGQLVKSPEFDGVRLDTIPKTEDTMVFMGPKGVAKITRGEKLSESILNDQVNKKTGAVTRKGLRTQVKEGKLKVIELYDPESNPLQGYSNITNERVRYVVTPNVDSKAIKWDQVPRRGGGHFEYEYNNYIKQARIRAENIDGKFTHWYEGDNTVMPIKIRGMGEELIKHMNAARELLDVGAEQAAKDYLEKNPIGVDWDEFSGWFKGKGSEAPRLSTAEPFQVVSRDSKIIDKGKEYLERRYEYKHPDGTTGTTLKDGTRQGSLARQYQVAYTRPRDAHEMMTVDNVGSASKPIYLANEAKLVDPIPMMNRALSKATNSMFMDDYKIQAIEHWISEAADHLKATDDELRHAPFYHFANASWNSFKPDTPFKIKSALMANYWKIRHFAGLPSKVDQFLHAAGQELADLSYDKFGPKVALIPAWLLPRAANPINLARSFVYHAKLGLFALPQLMVQNMTWVTMAGITPEYTAKAIPATLFHQWSRINMSPGFLKKMDGYMEKFGWRPGEWSEALREGNNTGFFHVGGEYINLDNLSQYRLIKGMGSDILDAGQIFFKEGEKNVRFGAWYAAFKEWRDLNPTKTISIADRNNILERADFLYTNMSRASASTLHTGIFSLSTQFLSYQLRLAELFFSKRLAPTLGERNMIRARLYGFNAAMFGAPAGAGLAGYPIGEAMRTYAHDNGYVVGDNFWSSLLMEGVPSMILALATGKGDQKKGNWYNFGERYGNQGMDLLKDVIHGDKTVLSLVGGAAGSVGSNVVAAADPFWKYLQAWYSGLNYGLTADNFVAPLKEIQSINAVWHSIAAANVGMWMSKNGTPLAPTTLLNAMGMAATGLSPQSVSDAYKINHSIKDEQNFQKQTIRDISDKLRAAQYAYSNNDISNGDALTTQAQSDAILAFGPDNNTDQMAVAWAQAYQDADKTLVDKIDWDYVYNNSSHRSLLDIILKRTPDVMQQRLQQWQSIQQMKENRGEK